MPAFDEATPTKQPRLFSSVDAVLRWAYAMEERSVLQKARMFHSGNGRRVRSWDGWSIWERHAQAAMVRAQVERMGTPLNAYAIASYARLEVRFPAAQVLVKWVAPEKIGGATATAYELIVEQYVLGSHGRRGGGIGPIRHELGCRKCAALDERRRIFALLDALRARVFNTIAEPLREGGLLADCD